MPHTTLQRQALHVATDSNVDLAGQLIALPGAVGQLSALVRGADVGHVKVSMSMRVQAAGVLVNVAGLAAGAAQSPEHQIELSQLVLPLLLEQMAYDPASLQQACVSLAADVKSAAAADTMDVDAEASTAVGGACGGSGSVADGEVGTVEMENAVGARVAAGVATATQIPMATVGSINGAVQPQGGSSGASERSGGEQPEEEVEERGNGEATPDQPDKDAQVRWEWKLGVAEPLKLTAEVMANLCSLAAGEEGEGDEEEWGSDDEDAMEQAASGGAGLQPNAQIGGGKALLVLLDAMAQGGALQRTLATLRALLSPTPRDQQPVAKISGTAGTMPPPLTGGAAIDRLPLPSGTASDLADLRATVALCAANLVQNLPPKALGDNLHDSWTDLCCMCEAAVQRAPSCVETLTGVMWGLLRRAGPAVAAGVRAKAALPPPPIGAGGFVTDPLSLILQLCDPETTRAFEARVNAVGMLGALGSTAVATENASLGVAGDGTDLGLGGALVRAMEDPHVLVQAEALNAVIDVYGDDDRDAAFRAVGLPAALVAGVPAFRRKVKQEGRALGRDALCHLKETALNASRFVKYKQAMERGRPGKGSR